MSEHKNLDLFDLLIILAKQKAKLLLVFIVSLIVSYTGIYFLVPEQFEAQTIIMPNETEQVAKLPTMLRNMANLTSSLTSLKKTTVSDYYKTIVYSRPMLEKIIDSFDLMKDYKMDSREKMLVKLRKDIKADENDQGAFEVHITALTPTKAANIANFIIAELNSRIIDFNSKKSRDNRIFIENRYKEVTNNIALAQDSIRSFQKRTGFLQMEQQTKFIIENISRLEGELEVKKIELRVLEKTEDQASPKFNSLRSVIDESERKIREIKNGQSGSELMKSIYSMPDAAMNYLSLYRRLKMSEAILEYIVPLYEQSKIEEQKDLPVLQIIEKAVPPEKKSYPPRTILALAFAVGFTMIVALWFILQAYLKDSRNEKFYILLKELRLKS